MLIKQQISILEWFLKDRDVTLEDWSYEAEISALHHRNQKYIKIENSSFIL